MTEADWRNELDWRKHLLHLGGRVGPRKLRLLAAGFCRLAERLFENPDCRKAVEVAERYAEGKASAAELEECKQRCRVVYVQAGEEYKRASERDPAESSRAWVQKEIGWAAFYVATGQLDVNMVAERTQDAVVGDYTSHSGVLPWIPTDRDTPLIADHRLLQREVVFDLFGPFPQPLVFEPDWRTSTSVALARTIAESGDFSTLPILADALQDAGCEATALLDHCRGASVHFRGCWAVDGVLGLS